MKDFLYTVFCIGVFIIGMVVAADVAVQVRHKLNGTPLAHKVFNEIIKAKDQTIESQKNTIKAQQEALRYDRKKVKELRARLAEYEEETDG